MTLARWGLPVLFWSALVLGWGVWLLPPGPCRWAGAGLAIAIFLFEIAFFRNPRRRPAGGPRALIAPADGVVADIGEADEADFIGGRCVRIGIFLSVFDVHVNRSPIAGTVAFAKYRPGRFLDARHPDVSHANEANALGIAVDPAVAPGVRLLLVQLTGLIARRIVCAAGVGDRLAQGELYGMIKFGSRTELWIPVDVPHAVKVKVGDRVRCGETVIAELLPTAG